MIDSHTHLSDKIYNMVANEDEMTIEELEWFIHTVFINVTNDQIAHITQNFSKTITRTEFNTILLSLANKKPTTTDVFNIWNKSNKHKLDAEDICNVFKNIGITPRTEYIQAIMKIFPESDMTIDTLKQMLIQAQPTE
ncbi:hypothetical protein CWI42_011190 [Ordospora colligata]|nr:hypothetical protein CWI42_011190 [Ordospora colligata]